MITVKVGKKPISKPNSFRDAIELKKKAFIEVSMQIITEDITRGIEAGQAISGGPLPALEPFTIMKKGHGRPLIDEGRLKSTETYNQVNSWRIGFGKITIKPIRAAIGEELQIDGISYGPGKRKKKYFNFFGISRDAAGRMNDLLDSIMSDVLKEL